MERAQAPIPIGTTVTVERLGETMEEMYVNMGPQHPSTHGVLRLMLKLDGEVGQQIGYLAAATVGAVNFILVLFIGWAFAHKEKVRGFMAKRRRGNSKS